MAVIIKYVLYGRVSPRPQDNESAEQQIKVCAEWVEHRNKVYGENGIVIGEFFDKMKSGGRLDCYKRGPRKGEPYRPGLTEAVEMACKEGAKLVCYNIDRCFKSMLDAVVVEAVLKKAGSGIITLTGLPVDTTTPEMEMFFRIQATFDEFNRKAGARRTKDAMLWHQAHGRRMSSIATVPYGMIVDPEDDSRIIPNRQERRNLAEMRRLRAEGYTYENICIALHIQNIFPRNAKAWNKGFVLTILKRDAENRAANSAANGQNKEAAG